MLSTPLLRLVIINSHVPPSNSLKSVKVESAVEAVSEGVRASESVLESLKVLTYHLNNSNNRHYLSNNSEYHFHNGSEERFFKIS